mgnify:CR=1 FL=1
MDPCHPHYVPSSPQSICSSDGIESLFGLADSLPIFPDATSMLETVPADLSRYHPSVQPTGPEEESSLSLGIQSQWNPISAGESSLSTVGQQLASAEESTEYSYLRRDLARRDLAGLVHHVVGQQWLSVAVRALTAGQLANLGRRTELLYGDDCSGARAPYEALVQVLTKLFQENLADIIICDKFASECPGHEGDGPRQFIRVQTDPDILFETVHRGANTLASLDLITGKLQRIPANLTIYIVGWVCRDVSPMNCHPKELLPGTHKKVVAGKAGASSQTLHSSLQYIRTHRPDIAILENLIFKKNISIAVTALKEMGGYSTIVLLIDSRTFAVPMSRRRMYVLAIRTHKLTAPLQELGSQLNDIAKQMPSISVDTLPKLLDEARSRGARKCASGGMPKLRCMKVPKKWRHEHDQLRHALGLPSRRDIIAQVKAHSPLAASLPTRCIELLGLHWLIAVRRGIDPSRHHFIWDLTNSASFGCVKDPRLAGLVPCVLRGHILWDTKMGRPLTGSELLQVHGFCLEPAVYELDDNILRKLAGDTISVPPIGCILMLALASIDDHHVGPINDHHVDPCWIGPSAWRGYDRSMDNLFKVAGLSPMLKARSSRLKAQRLQRRSSRSSSGLKRKLQTHISLE